MRRLGLALTAVLALSLLSACTKPSLPLLGVRSSNGQAVVVLVTCIGISYDVFVNEDPPASTSPGSVLALWAVSGDARTGTVEIPVYGELPEGWTVSPMMTRDAAGLPSPLPRPDSELHPGTSYYAGALGPVWGVDFTTADLNQLDGRHVLTSDKYGGRRTTTYDDFVATALHARGSCPNR